MRRSFARDPTPQELEEFFLDEAVLELARTNGAGSTVWAVRYDPSEEVERPRVSPGSTLCVSWLLIRMNVRESLVPRLCAYQGCCHVRRDLEARLREPRERITESSIHRKPDRTQMYACKYSPIVLSCAR